MNSRILSAVGLFIASIFVGYNILSTVEPVQAQQPVIPSYLELMSMMHSNKEAKSVSKVDTIEVSYDVNTQEVSVKGTADAIVNVTTTGELKPVVKWRTKVIEKEAASGYPYIKSVGIMPDSIKAISPLSKVKSYGK